jgi:hypothetical protein
VAPAVSAGTGGVMRITVPRLPRLLVVRGCPSRTGTRGYSKPPAISTPQRTRPSAIAHPPLPDTHPAANPARAPDQWKSWTDQRLRHASRHQPA